jgi:hypothetical protein
LGASRLLTSSPERDKIKENSLKVKTSKKTSATETVLDDDNVKPPRPKVMKKKLTPAADRVQDNKQQTKIQKPRKKIPEIVNKTALGRTRKGALIQLHKIKQEH